jgi:hypothetical protein
MRRAKGMVARNTHPPLLENTLIVSAIILRYIPQNFSESAVIPLFFALCRKCPHTLANYSE